MVSAEQKAARACGLRCGVSERERERESGGAARFAKGRRRWRSTTTRKG